MFESAKLKLQRAKDHIDGLALAFRTFIESNPCAFSIDHDTKTNLVTLDVTFSKPIPSQISLIVGDAVHNLWSALDHATWELIGIDGGTRHNQLYFPTGKDRSAYEGTCKGMRTGADTVQFFIDLAVYE